MKKASFLLSFLFLFCPWAKAEPDQEATTDSTSKALPSATPLQNAPQNAEQPKPNAAPNARFYAPKPPNYGSLIIDWGFDFLQGAPKEMKHSFWGSRMASAYLYYNIRLGQSHFVISPGIGYSGERYQFSKHKLSNDKEVYYTLVRDSKSKDAENRTTKLEDTENVLQDSTAQTYSALDIRYLDFALEFRFNTNQKYPKEGFFVALGGSFGKLLSAYTTVFYKMDNQTKKRTESETFNLRNFRYGVHARLGWNRLGAIYSFSISPLFSKDQGPEGTEARVHCVGISLDLF